MTISYGFCASYELEKLPNFILRSRADFFSLKHPRLICFGINSVREIRNEQKLFSFFYSGKYGAMYVVLNFKFFSLFCHFELIAMQATDFSLIDSCIQSHFFVVSLLLFSLRRLLDHISYYPSQTFFSAVFHCHLSFPDFSSMM